MSPFGAWMSRVEAAVATSDVETVEALVEERTAEQRRGADGTASLDPRTHPALTGAPATAPSHSGCAAERSGGAHGATGNAATSPAERDTGCEGMDAGDGGAVADSRELPVELEFKLKRLKVLGALRSGDLWKAHALTATYLGPLAARQPSLQATLSVCSPPRGAWFPSPSPPSPPTCPHASCYRARMHCATQRSMHELSRACRCSALWAAV